MKTLDRYIASLFCKNLFLGILAMSTIFLFQSMFTDLYDRSYPIRQVLFFHGLNVPKVIVEMAPASTLMATVLTLSGLSRTHELVACYAIGYGLRRLMALIFSVVMLVSCLILVMEDRILPPLYKVRTNYYWHVIRKHPDFFLDIRRDKIWYRSKNMIYNLQRFDLTSNTIFGMSVYTFDDDFNLIQVVDAQKAQFTPEGWKLRDGVVTVFSAEDPFPMVQDFAEKEMRLSETPLDFQEIEKEVDGLRLKELHRYIQRMKNAGADTKSYEVKFHARIGLSFVPLVMAFLAIPFSVGTRRAGGLAKDLGLCLACTFSYWLFYSTGLSLGSKGALSPWLAAWLPSMIFVALGTALIIRKQSA